MEKTCGKRAFNSLQEANIRLKEIIATSENYKGNDLKPSRSYKCDKCGLYHLTSFTKKKYVNGIINGGFKQKRINRIANHWISKKGWDNSQK